MFPWASRPAQLSMFSSEMERETIERFLMSMFLLRQSASRMSPKMNDPDTQAKVRVCPERSILSASSRA